MGIVYHWYINRTNLSDLKSLFKKQTIHRALCQILPVITQAVFYVVNIRHYFERTK